MKGPIVRSSKRSFTLCYVRRSGFRKDCLPNEIVGFGLRVFFRKRDEPVFTISAYSEGWSVVDNNYFANLQEMFLVAEVFYKIFPEDWIGVHPNQGERLYSSPITNIEKLHKSIIKRVNEYRAGESLVKFNTLRAVWAGVA